jgi:predicted metal-dependent phosphoesterase TrpH
LAHPGRPSRGEPIDGAALASLAAAGLDGVEVVHPVHDDAARERYAAGAEALGLVATGGSDWHGRRRDPLPGAIGVDATGLGRLQDRIAARRAALG